MTLFRATLALILLSCPALGLAEQVIKKQKTVTFAAYDSPPWYIHSETGPATGVIPHYAQQLTGNTKYRVKVAPMPYQRIIGSANDKSIDFVTSIEHPELFKTAYPYIKLGKIAAVVYSATSLDDLLVTTGTKKAKIGVLRGITPLVYKLAPKELTDTWEIIEVSTEESGFRSAQLGRLDATILSRNVYEYLVDEEGGTNPGYAEDLGFFTVFAWLPKRTKLNYELINMRKHIEKITHGGKIVLDWRTALNRFETAEGSEQRILDSEENAELRKLLNKLHKNKTGLQP